MGKLISVTLLVLLAAQVYCQTSNSCSTLTTETQCGTNQLCAWGKTPEESCSSPKCEQFDNQVSCSEVKGNCSWTAAKDANCAINSTYCTLSAAGATTCNDADNCVFNAATDATCTSITGGFGCSKNADQPTCEGSKQCNWSVSDLCQDTKYCSQQTNVTDCSDDNGCSYVAQSCKNLTNVCETYVLEADCTNNSCAFDATSGTCSAPKCTITNNCSSPLCTVATGFCANTLGFCGKLDQVGCVKTILGCSWNNVQKCIDSPTYCAAGACDANLCKNVPATQSSCTANPKSTSCSSIVGATDCGTAKQCTYNTATEAECNITNKSCPTISLQTTCNAELGCDWVSVYGCSAVGGGSSFAQNLIASFALFVLALLI